MLAVPESTADSLPETKHKHAFSRRNRRPRLACVTLDQRGCRECRVLAAPAVSCATSAKKRTRAYRYSWSTPAFPAQWFDGLYRSPWRRIPLASIAGGLKDCRNPVGSTFLRQLDTSNGCQNHTALPYAASPVVRTLCPLTGQGPPCEHDHAPDAAASTATRPNVRDDGQRPSSGTGWRDL